MGVGPAGGVPGPALIVPGVPGANPFFVGFAPVPGGMMGGAAAPAAAAAPAYGPGGAMAAGGAYYGPAPPRLPGVVPGPFQITDFDMMLYMALLSNPENSKNLIVQNPDLYKTLTEYVQTNQGGDLVTEKKNFIKGYRKKNAYVSKITDFEKSFSRKIGSQVSRALRKATRRQKPKISPKEPTEINQRSAEGGEREQQDKQQENQGATG